MEILLNGTDWQAEGYLPDGYVFNMESGIDFRIWPIIPAVPAAVPGSIHNDLYRAGVIENPYYGRNALDCEWVENKEWRVFKQVKLDPSALKRHTELVLEGLNFEARVYWNKRLLGTHKNVNTACRFSLDGLIEEDNLLDVVLVRIPPEEAQMGRTSVCALQAERFAYSWDFCTRLVGVGVWKDVKLVSYDELRLSDVCLTTDYAGGKGVIDLTAECSADAPAEAEMTVSFDGKQVFAERRAVRGTAAFRAEIENPALWYPAGYGEQNLYEVAVTLKSAGAVEDTRVLRAGIRHLEYWPNRGASKDAINYTVAVNGKAIYLKGVNFLPIDHMLGTMTRERYEENLALVAEGNFNLIRLWGGGVRENEILFELCDKYGILVWQDFTQSNSGLDGIPSERPEFLKGLAESAEAILRQCRNHVCTAIYCGGNELKDAARNPVGFDNANIKMLQGVVKRLDPQRIFHPSCPSGPNFSGLNDAASKAEKKNHNIHGQWAYLGEEAHYRYYNEADFLYQGEFGVNGCSDEDSLAKFLPPENMQGYKTADELWTYRNYTWWNSYYREKAIFGEKSMEIPERYVAASQLMQAEGIRYIVEQNRNRAFECSGCNIWQFGEPWPNPNCGNLVDFYLRPKQAYYTVRESYRRKNVNLRYEKIWYEAGEQTDMTVSVSNFGAPADCAARVELISAEGRVLEALNYPVTAASGTTEVCRFSGRVDQKWGGVFFVRLQLFEGGETVSENLYQFGTSRKNPYETLFQEPGDVVCRAKKEGDKRTVTLENVGNRPALYLNLFCDDLTGVRFSDNFITLFPGERRTIAVTGAGERGIYVKDFTRTIRKTAEETK